MDVLTAVLAVFTGIGNWMISAVQSMLPMFYASDTGLTILGVLATASLGFSVIFLVLGFVRRFFSFRG